MNAGIQRDLSELGEAGCYLISITRLAEIQNNVRFDITRVYEDALAHGDIRSDCFVLEAARLLSRLTAKSWSMSKQPADYAVKPSELEILRYEWAPKPMTTLGHFVVGNGSGRVAFDPMGDNSPVVKNGKLASKRVFFKS